MLEREVRLRVLQLEICWNRSDIDAVLQLFDRSASLQLGDTRRRLTGQDEIRQWMTSSMQAHPRIGMDQLFLQRINGASAASWLVWRAEAACTSQASRGARSLLYWERRADGLLIRASRITCKRTG